MTRDVVNMPEGEDKEHILDIVENEGFDYAFQSYSEFSEVKDEEFHRLRKWYLDAVKQLQRYIGFQD